MNHTENSWMGYKRKDGRKGIRNRVLVIYTVKCAEHVARKIVDEVHHPEVELLGFDGCTDNQYAVNMLDSDANMFSRNGWKRSHFRKRKFHPGSGSRMKEERFRRSKKESPGFVRR